MLYTNENRYMKRFLPSFLSVVTLVCCGCVPSSENTSASINNEGFNNGDSSLSLNSESDQPEVENSSLEETENEEIINGIISTRKGVYGGQPFGEIVIDHEDGFSVGNVTFGNGEELSQNTYPGDPDLCLYIKNLEERYLISIGMTISGFKEKILKETGEDCVYFEQ